MSIPNQVQCVGYFCELLEVQIHISAKTNTFETFAVLPLPIQKHFLFSHPLGNVLRPYENGFLVAVAPSCYHQANTFCESKVMRPALSVELRVPALYTIQVPKHHFLYEFCLFLKDRSEPSE